MSRKTLKYQDYSMCDADQKDRVLRDFAQGVNGKPNGEIKDLNQVISIYEQKYSMTSEELINNLRTGKTQESFDICKWLMFLQKKVHLEQYALSWNK